MLSAVSSVAPPLPERPEMLDFVPYLRASVVYGGLNPGESSAGTANPTTMRTATLSALLFLSLGQRALAATNAAAIAVEVSLPGEKNPVELRNAFAARVLAGLESFRMNLAPVTDPAVIDRALGCEGALCLQDLARLADLALVVQLRVQARKTGKKGKLDYALWMLVARNAPERNAWREKGECSACDVFDAKQQVFLLAGTIGERIQADSPKTGQASTTPRPRFPSATGPGGATTELVAPTTAQPPERYVPRYLSVAALASGAVAAGVGIYLIHLNGQGTCDLAGSRELCPRRYKTQGLGIGLLTVGGLAMLGGLGGLVLLPPGPGDHDVALTFDGSSVSLEGAF